ncbi:MAG: hypothetical protein KU37_07385 [Sulfuricurvum sp. PC08-66]|nr:MAG: hypothetical protein KU37_07385 [Sulfuricurvum sp. PC08-66]
MVIQPPKTYSCAFTFTLDKISGKWKSLVLWYLSNGTLRYSELRKHLAPITQKMLTQTLRELEADALIVRTVYPVVPPKVEYSLTPSAQKLVPIFHMLQEWGIEVGGELGVITACGLKK